MMRPIRWLGGSLAAAVLLAACSDTSEMTGPVPGDDARLIGPQQTTVEIDAIYSGDPARPSGTIVLTDEWVYVEILDVEAHLPTPNASAEDVRIGDDWETGVAAESFEILDINQDGNRDIRLRWDLEELEDAGHLPEGTVTIQVFGQDPNTGAEFEGEMEVEVIGDPGITFCSWDNGGMVTHPGAGAGGADVSMASTIGGVSTAGSNVQQSLGGPHFRIADDFEVTQTCTLGYVVTNGYQTGAAVPTWTNAQLNVRAGSVTGTIVASATSTDWEWSGVYRVFNGLANLGNTQRPVHEIFFEFDNVVLEPGTYWIDWQVVGGASGWAPYVMLPDPSPGGINTITVFENGQQMFNAAGDWQPTLQPPGAEVPFRVGGGAPARGNRGVPDVQPGPALPSRYNQQVTDAH
jgi:hypothetical protein